MKVESRLIATLPFTWLGFTPIYQLVEYINTYCMTNFKHIRTKIPQCNCFVCRGLKYCFCLYTPPPFSNRVGKDMLGDLHTKRSGHFQPDSVLASELRALKLLQWMLQFGLLTAKNEANEKLSAILTYLIWKVWLVEQTTLCCNWQLLARWIVSPESKWPTNN